MKALTYRSVSLVIAALITAPLLALAVASSIVRSQPETVTYAVTYKAFGKPSSKWVNISYIDHLSYGAERTGEMPSVRVPASALPWRKTVRLSEERLAFVIIEEGDELNKGQLGVSISVNGKWQNSTGSAHIHKIHALRIVRDVIK